MSRVSGNALRAERRAKAASGRMMMNYPADFTLCGCMSYSYGSIGATWVARIDATHRRCEECGATWEGDMKRHVRIGAFDIRSAAIRRRYPKSSKL